MHRSRPDDLIVGPAILFAPANRPDIFPKAAAIAGARRMIDPLPADRTRGLPLGTQGLPSNSDIAAATWLPMSKQTPVELRYPSRRHRR